MQSKIENRELTCPACAGSVPIDAKSCPHCGFHNGLLDQRFGSIPKYDSYVTDLTERTLSPFMINSIKRLFRRFECHFPQIRLSLVVLALHKKWSLNEYIFYLANRCNFVPASKSGKENCLILFCVDVKLKQVAISTGYGLEEVLQPDDLQGILDIISTKLEAGKYRAFTRVAIRNLKNILLKKLK